MFGDGDFVVVFVFELFVIVVEFFGVFLNDECVDVVIG